jgi:hypothetical protein
MFFAAPTSQKHRPVGFAIVEANKPLGVPLLLPVRPEELTLTEPYRVTPHQTLGGAYVDVFGRGLGQLTIAGSTGWRGGEEAFVLVRTLFELWARLREARVAEEKSPDDIELWYLDTLNLRSLKIVPNAFTLQRSVRQPLLCRFHIQCTVIGDLFAQVETTTLKTASDVGNTLVALSSGIAQMQDAAVELETYTHSIGTFAPAGASLARTQTRVVSQVTSDIETNGAISSDTAATYQLAVDLAAAGRTLYVAAAAAPPVSGTTLPIGAKHTLARLIGGFTSFWCALKGVQPQLTTTFTPVPLFGASNCSSTSGGRAISEFVDLNAFTEMYPVPAPPQIQTEASRQMMASTAALDPLQDAMTFPRAAERARIMTNGIRL